jgi:hypothetical protein
VNGPIRHGGKVSESSYPAKDNETDRSVPPRVRLARIIMPPEPAMANGKRPIDEAGALPFRLPSASLPRFLI